MDAPAAPDELLRTLSGDGGVVVRAVTGARVVDEAARRHGTGPVATDALGRTLLMVLAPQNA